MNVTLDLDGLRYDKERGTVVVVAQDAVTGRVLMVAHADREALEPRFVVNCDRAVPLVHAAHRERTETVERARVAHIAISGIQKVRVRADPL